MATSRTLARLGYLRSRKAHKALSIAFAMPKKSRTPGTLKLFRVVGALTNHCKPNDHFHGQAVRLVLVAFRLKLVYTSLEIVLFTPVSGSTPSGITNFGTSWWRSTFSRLLVKKILVREVIRLGSEKQRIWVFVSVQQKHPQHPIPSIYLFNTISIAFVIIMIPSALVHVLERDIPKYRICYFVSSIYLQQFNVKYFTSFVLTFHFTIKHHTVMTSVRSFPRRCG